MNVGGNMNKPKQMKAKLPEDAKPYKGTVVVIENDKKRTTIWLELDEKRYQVRKVSEIKNRDRH